MNERTTEALLAELAEQERRADEGGGPARLERQNRLGRLSARERIARLADPGSFVEVGRHVKSRHGTTSARIGANLAPGDGVIAGLCAIEGRTVAVYAHDPTVLRGSLGQEAAKKVCRVLDLALERRYPVVALVDCEGVRVEEGTDGMVAFGELIRRTIGLKGKVPQLTLVCGLCVGGAAYNAVLTDCVGMVDGQSFMFVTGSKVTQVVTGEQNDIDELGGPKLHAQVTGSVHAVVPDETSGLDWVKRVLRLIDREAQNPTTTDPVDRGVPELLTLIPANARRGYDMRRVLDAVFDRGSLLFLSDAFGKSLLTAFGRLGGRSVAIVASQPSALAGALDVNASRKGAAFVRWAHALGLPLLTFVDTPGYLPGKQQEENGILPHGASLLDAYASAAVPKLCLIVRKSYGGASVLSFAADVRLALPTASVAVMGSEAAADVVYSNGAASVEEPWLSAESNAFVPAEMGYIDRVIHPERARAELSLALERLSPTPRSSADE